MWLNYYWDSHRLDDVMLNVVFVCALGLETSVI